MTSRSSRPAPVPDDLPDVVLHGPRALLSALPYLLGYRPTNCMVLVNLNQDNECSLTTRAELPSLDPNGLADRIGDRLADLLTRSRMADARCAVAVLYCPDPSRAEQLAGAPPLPVPGLSGPAGVQLAQRLAELAAERGVMLADAMVVRSDRWASMACADAQCCPAQGRAMPGPLDEVAVRAEFVGRGRSVLGSREELERVLARDPSFDAAPLGRSAARVRAQLRRRERSASDVLERAWLSATRAPDRPWQPAESGLFLAAMRHRGIRDAVVRRAAIAAQTGAHGWHELWLRVQPLLRMAPPGWVAGVAAVAAAFAWQCGDGTGATIALQRCVADDPSHRLGGLLLAVVQSGMPPATWARQVAGLSEEICLAAGP